MHASTRDGDRERIATRTSKHEHARRSLHPHAVRSEAMHSVIALPIECTAVLEGLQNAANLPFADGTSRVMIVDDASDMAVPVGASITRLGFGRVATLTTMDAGRYLQLEVRMGCTTNSATATANAFDTNEDGPSITVLGPANTTVVLAIAVDSQLVPPYALDPVFVGIAPTCRGQLAPLDLVLATVTTSSSGGFPLGYAVPNVLALNDLWLSHQALPLAAFAPGGIVVSNGVQVQVGFMVVSKVPSETRAPLAMKPATRP
jgi:hypothetical protein